MSPLTRLLALLLEQVRGEPLAEETCALLEIIVTDHGLEGDHAPQWMFDFLNAIRERRVGRPRFSIPVGYPLGEEGLANVFADIEQELMSLGIDDYGEGMVWPIHRLGLRVVIIREWSEQNHYGVAIEPLPKRRN
jgi:hypothetical protein